MKFLVIIVTIALITFSSTLSVNRSATMLTSTYMNRFQWPTRSSNTNLNEYGGGRVIYLDRHKTDCGIGAVSQFRFKRITIKGQPRMRIETVCIMPNNCVGKCPLAIKKLDNKLCKWKSTRPQTLQDWGGLATNQLDKHYVKCPPKFVITNFKLNTNAHTRHQVSYSYRCCPATTISCSSRNIGSTPYGDLSTGNLEKQIVAVPNIRTQAINGFKLTTNSSAKTFSYHVDFCEIKG